MFLKCILLFSLAFIPATHALTDTHREELKRIVNDCLSSLEDGESARRYEFRNSTDVVTKKKNKLHISAKVQLRYEENFSRAEFLEALSLIEQARQWVEAFYKQHFLDLEIEFMHEIYRRNQRNPYPIPAKGAHVVYIRKYMGDAMNATTWGVNFDWETQLRAQIYTHEFSHLLGLEDEYETRRSTRIGERDNIMRNWDAPNAKFYPHQIQEIISPLCPY